MKLLLTQIIKALKQPLNCPSGSIAVPAALAITALVIGVGISVDYGSMVLKKSSLQTAADAASIATAREMMVANDQKGNLAAVAKSMVLLKPELASASLSISVSVDKANASVEVALTESWAPFFAHLLSIDVTPVTARSTAQIAGTANVCVLGLGESLPKSVFLDHNAKLTGNNCGVFSNSTDSDAIRSDANGQIRASLICAAGGVTGSTKAFSPTPITDCPAIPDPLIDRPEPKAGSCTFKNLEIKDEMRTLSPGVYCEGLKISGKAQVKFQPGLYVIKGAKFHVQDEAQITGENVGFYLADEKALFEFTEDTSIELTAPKDGPLVGVLFFDSRSLKPGRKHRINSNNARKLIGTFYLPQSTLLVDSKSPVADESAFTVIIAQTVELLENPNLVLNSDYSQTDIPAPKGLLGGQIVLTK